MDADITQLGDINLNATIPTPPLALASPFVPADPNTLWGPPPPLGTTAALTRQLSVEEVNFCLRELRCISSSQHSDLLKPKIRFGD